MLLDHLDMTYEPFPVGVSRPAMPAAAFERLAGAWPPEKLFRYMPELGHKWSLSEVNHPEQYRRFVRESAWRDFHSTVKGPAFVADVVDVLAAHHVDLGLDTKTGPVAELKRFLRRRPTLSARFEFSMLPANGGHIKPHTDHPRKLITLVVAMNRAWDKTWGGSTDMLRPTDPRNYFNELNRQLEFDEVETTSSYEFQPNQCLVFVKTFNSLHAVSPMQCPVAAMRRTLTVNIER